MHSLKYPEVPLHEVMRATAERHPDRVAIVHGDSKITFAQFDLESNRLANGFASLGLASGDRLGLYLPNCLEFELAFYAASKLGAIVCPLNPSYREREISYQLNDSGAKVLVTHATLWPVVASVRPHLTSVETLIVVGASGDVPRDAVSYAGLMASQGCAPPDVQVRQDQLVALPYSSGTTGLPKGVMLTHRNLVCNHVQFGTASGLGPTDVYPVYLPLSHIYGSALMGLAMWSGAQQILLERFQLDRVVRAIEEHGATRLHVVPPVLLALADAPGLRPEQFRSVEFALNAAAPLAPDVARRVEARLGLRVIQAYGMTEASPDTHHSPLDPARVKLESGGVPVADTEHRVVDPATGEALANGATGEIVVRGPQVMQGYWNAPEETRQTLRDGWLHTGDIGWIDDDGFVFIVDRKKEMIKYKSFSIAPAELEAVLLEHPEVADCAVTGVADSEAGEVPKAFVVPRGGRFDRAALEQFVSARVAGYKTIRHWEVAAQIPRTPSGKILRRLLKAKTAVAALVLAACLTGGGCALNAQHGPEAVSAGEFVVEPATLIALGFEWYIEGDANRNSSVAVSYRQKGAADWKPALPLLRIHNERTQHWSFDYVAGNLFAGSIIDLSPDTEYEARFVLSDPDGVRGQAQRVVSVRTRPEPVPYAGGRILHVYPPGSDGPRQEPWFEGLMAAYFTGSVGGDWYNSYPPRVQPGDTILVHAGVYQDQRLRYGHELRSGFKECCGNTGDGTYYLTKDGTADRPIVIKAAGDGEVVFDGDGNYVLFNVTAADHTYFEGITFRNTAIAIEAGRKDIAGSTGLTVKHSRFEDVGIGIHTDYSGSKNYYIADNVMIGRHDPTTLVHWGTPTPGMDREEYIRKSNTLSQYAVKVYGSGHVVAHNRIENFHDGIDHATYGHPDGYPDTVRERMPVANDFYNNDISNVHDNCIEADGAMHNVRVLRNRCTNSASQGFSLQPFLGGPAYFIRNTLYHSPTTSAIKLSGNPSGGVFYHNTFTAGISAGAGSNMHFRNNLVLVQVPGAPALNLDTYDGYSTSDYNGYAPSDGAKANFRWTAPADGGPVWTHGQAGEVREFRTSENVRAAAQRGARTVPVRPSREHQLLDAFSRATGLERNSRLVDWSLFVRVPRPDPQAPTKIYSPASIDFSLRDGASAIDAGIVLPNVNDGFVGAAPDLGALEAGQPAPHYGPRTSVTSSSSKP